MQSKSATAFALSAVLSLWVCPCTIKFFRLPFYPCRWSYMYEKKIPAELHVCVPEQGNLGTRLIYKHIMAVDWLPVHEATHPLPVINCDIGLDDNGCLSMKLRTLFQ